MSDEDRARALALVQRHGWNSTSFQALEPGYRYWFDGEACVAYVEAGRAWVVAGAPIAPEERLGEVTLRFLDEAARAGRRACFFGVEARFLERAGLPAVQIGEQPVWDPRAFAASSSKSLKEQLRRARNKGVTVRSAAPSEVPEGLAARWLAKKAMAPLGFLVELELRAHAEERRTFLAEREGRVVAALMAVPIYARGGWLLEDLLREDDAPNGTSELLVDFAMRSLAEEGASYATLGLAPLAGEVPRALAHIREWSRPLYDFHGLRAFKSKLRPERWDPIYLAARYAPALAIFDVLRAFARGSLRGFAVRTLLRGPTPVLFALGLALIPWAAMLALLPTEDWFPSRAVQLAWVGFDLALAGAILALARRWRRGLGALVLGAIVCDFALTLAEALAFNAPRASSPLECLGIAIGCAAPLVGGAVLWGAHRRHLVSAT